MIYNLHFSSLPALLLASLLVLFGCDDDTGNANDDTSNTQNDTSENDTNTQDTATQDTGGGDDTATQDTGGADDTSTADTATQDTGTTDTGTADTGTADASDAGGADTTVDDDGCADGFTAFAGVDADIVACAGATESLSQCDASQACGAGWHMCTASEYQSRYTAAEHPETNNFSFWLASCIRDGGDTQVPSDVICSDCTGTQTGSEADVAQSCVNGLVFSTDQLYVGVRAGFACASLGDISDNSTQAFWNFQLASSTQNGAFCCK